MIMKKYLNISLVRDTGSKSCSVLRMQCCHFRNCGNRTYFNRSRNHIADSFPQESGRKVT